MRHLRRLRPAVPWLLVTAWLLTRWLLLGLRKEFWYVSGDVSYYWLKIEALPHDGLARTMTEYPTPVVWGFQLLRELATSYDAFKFALGAAMLAADAILAVVLYRRSRHPVTATSFWILVAPLLGLLCIYRFDMVPAVLVGLALALHHRRPGLAGALVAVGAAVKLWPALLIIPLLVDRRRRRSTGVGFGVVGGLLGLASLLLSGWARSVSPLTWQSDRGLQIESVPATLLMLRRARGDREVTVQYTQFNAYEVFGPGVAEALRMSTWLNVVALVVIVALAVRAFRSREPHRSGPAMLVLTIVALMVLTNKTLSPQYVLWLVAPVAAGLGITWSLGGSRARAVIIALATAGIAALTWQVYPMSYGELIAPGTGKPEATYCLVMRNGLLVGLTALLALWTWTCFPRGDAGPGDQPATNAESR